MTKNELTKEVSVSEKLHLSTTFQAVDGIFRVIKETLQKGQSVTIRGFGSFQPVDVAERPGRNINKGEPLVIPAHKSVKFRISKDFAQSLNAKEGKEATV